uniref:Uncharacterized protein n=1 Tax=Triticum urartu TaxID=4572 RepID=A0A8R7P238_TRIUA
MRLCLPKVRTMHTVESYIKYSCLTKYSASFFCRCSVKKSLLLATMCGSLAISWGATGSGTRL